MVAKTIFALAVAFAVAHAGTVELQPDFDLSRYTGKWYEIYRTANMPFESGTDNEANYAANADGTVAVLNREWLPDKQEWNEAAAVATVVGNAQLTVQFFPNTPPGDYRVLYTDYDDVAVVYSEFAIFGVVVTKYAWVLARQPAISDKVDKQVFQIFQDRTTLRRGDFHKTEHGVAPKVQTRRAASGTIPLQPDFDLGRYTGKWYEIYRTTNMVFESGTDNEANYAANQDGTVAVLNREWLPEKNQWNEASAVATVVANAQLAVKFGPFQPPGDYRVLYTDYDDVAVVYSEFAVFGVVVTKYAWVLGRKPAISDEVDKQVFQIFEERTTLRKNDFHKTEHGVAPKTQTRRAASNDVPLQPDFNLAAYTGNWFEIYRTKNIPFESGTDITALYGANADGSVSVKNSEWLPDKQKWNIANGVATVVSNARLAVKFGRFQPAGDYRVLYTDYNDVAVVYSEVEVFGIKFTRYGWMLARSADVSEATIQKAFGIFQERIQLTPQDFVKTQHGIAPHA